MNHFLPDVFRILGDGLTLAEDARVVDEHVEGTQFFPDRIRETLNVVSVRDIRDDVLYSPELAKLVTRGFQIDLVPSAYNHGRAFPEERGCDPFAYTLASAGDEGLFALELHTLLFYQFWIVYLRHLFSLEIREHRVRCR